MFLVDGSAFVFRSFHALPDLRTRDGMPTGAIYGLLNMIQGLLNEYQPEYLVVAFDRPEPTFRHEAYADYKANLAQTSADELTYLGIAICGPKKLINGLTGQLGLLR